MAIKFYIFEKDEKKDSKIKHINVMYGRKQKELKALFSNGNKYSSGTNMT